MISLNYCHSSVDIITCISSWYYYTIKDQNLNTTFLVLQEGEIQACINIYLDFLDTLKYIFFLLLLFFFTLQYCIGFAIHQHASATGYTCSPS